MQKQVMSGNTILLVEDDTLNTQAFNSMLDQLGYEADSVLDGRQAVIVIQSRLNKGLPPYKLVLMDYSMPVMDGPHCTRHILQLFKENEIDIKNSGQPEPPYICCCTAYCDERYRTQAYASGMNHFVNKPIFKDELMEIFRKAKMY